MALGFFSRYLASACMFCVPFSFCLALMKNLWCFCLFVMMQAAKEFESELKTEPEDSVAGSSPVAMSNKAEEKTEVLSSSKDNV